MRDSPVHPALVAGFPDERTRLQGPSVRPFIFAIVVFIFALTQFLPAVDNREFHRDEARWIHRGAYIEQIFDPWSDVWDEDHWIAQGGTMDEKFRLRAQPPLGSYVMGLGFLLQGQSIPDIGFWNMDQDDAWNAEHGNLPTQDQLMTGRRTNAFVSALTVVAVFFVARRATNTFGGLVAAAFLAPHPLMIYIATFAGSDAVLGLTIALAAVAAYRFADRPTWLRAIFLGVMIGLGASAKLSPMGISAALAGLGILLLIARPLRRSSGREDALPGTDVALKLIATPLVAGFTLIASYPYLWRDPIDNTVNLLDYRTLGMELQSSLWEGIAVDGPIEALQRIGDRLGAEYTVAGRLLTMEGHSLSVEMAIAVAGLVLLIWLVMRRGIWSATGLLAAVLTSEVAITIFGLKADWARYHLPILLLMAVCIGTIAGGLWTAVYRPRSRALPATASQS